MSRGEKYFYSRTFLLFVFLLYCFVKEVDEEKRMNFFLKYVQLVGAYADEYYQPELLNNTICYIISKDILSAYYINLALNTNNVSIIANSYLRTALGIFTSGFRNEIQKLL